MPQYFKEYAERLVGLGYSIVPLPPGRKGPNLKGWSQLRLDAAQARKMAMNGSAQCGIGVLSFNTPLIDIDVMDPEIAQRMSEAIDNIFPGVALMTRTGKAPKFGVPMRSAQPFRKLTSSVYSDGRHEHKVEILGDGQQWVAYHQHPETGKPYAYCSLQGDAGILDVPQADLPELTPQDALRIVNAFEAIASKLVAKGRWTLKTAARYESSPKPSDDPFAEHAEPLGKSYEEVARILAQIPNDETDYDTWFGTLAAIHHELGDAGRDIAYEWSSGSAKHADEVFSRKWESLGRYPGRPLTIRALLKRAGETEPEHKPVSKNGNPFAIHKWIDYKQNYLAVPWIIKSVLPQAEIGILYGPSGSGKTFFVLDMATAIARGVSWRGRKVNGCRVVYVAAEAREGIKKRMDAYDQHVSPDGERPDIIACAPNMLSVEDATNLADAIGKAGLIVIDTMAAAHSGDENSAKDMGLFLAACKNLSLATGAMVLAVHHTGKEESKGMRGSSALFAGADFVMEVFKNEKEHGATLSKSRDDASGVTFGFLLKKVTVGQDAEGEEVTTCVVEPLGHEVSKVGKRPKKLANLEDSRYDMHREMLTIFERITDESPTREVSKDAIIEAVQKKYPSKLKRNLAVVLLKLVEMGVIRESLGAYSLADDEL